jgi:hypothetical protein
MNLGKPIREKEIEPLYLPVPLEEPTEEPVPQEPLPDKEKVPA